MQQQCKRCAGTVEPKQKEFFVVPRKNANKYLSPKTTFALDKTKIHSPYSVIIIYVSLNGK